MRYLYDATAASAAALAKLNPKFVALYLTGSGSIRWLPAQVALFPGAEFVRIDQGGQTSPQYEAHVFDAEPGAWSIPGAVAACAKCTAPRPTIYCDRSDYRTIPPSFKGDIWLAAPGFSDAQAIALAGTDHRIVAVQNVWANFYDRSIVIDPNWPNKAPVVPPPVNPPPKPTGLPTGIEYVAFATASQINAKCNVTAGPELEYEWQLERLFPTGWELTSQQKTTGPIVSFKGLEPKSHYRFRVTRGTWSDWVNVAT
jgi:hypothetical protein